MERSGSTYYLQKEPRDITIQVTDDHRVADERHIRARKAYYSVSFLFLICTIKHYILLFIIDQFPVCDSYTI